jgi:hypothetical protein
MDKRPGILPELIIPVGAILFALYYLSTVWTLPFQAKVVGIYVSAAIGILSLILFVRFAGQIARGKKDFSFHGFFSDPVSESRRWGAMGATILFIALMPVTGFALTLFVYVLTLVLLVGGREKMKAALIISTSITAIAFAIFILAVKVRFPQSAVDEFLKSLVL